MLDAYLIIILAPLIGAIVAGFSGRMLGNSATALLTILGVAISFLFSLQVFANQVLFEYPSVNQNLYTWMQIGTFNISIGFLIDELTSMMMVLVTFVSLMVHIYTIGYMKGEEHFTRFFAYISLFTFAMLMLVMSNNFMQLFFGWEAVGLVSYLLIGFYHTKESAVSASLKAFLVNRVGDFGFLLAIALIFAYFGTLDYAEVFAQLTSIESSFIFNIELITVITLLLFVGAMGKSAQMPLHVWLPGSMEGPTPISALIHAATMVTAGIFMVARLSPMFELSTDTLTFILIVGGFTAFFMGLIGLVQNDIKKVIAYSTLSQLGYMTVALGVGGYSIAVFHLFTHGFFKALLFLAAGSVIIAHHHNQDILKMGGLRKKMPITFITFVIGTLALIGFPGFAGFYSKDMIIEAVALSNNAYADMVYYMVVAGVFITTLYSMRLLFMVFYGTPKDSKLYHHAKESDFSVIIPLMLLAIPSIVIGAIAIEPMLFGGMFAEGISYSTTMHSLQMHFVGTIAMISHAVVTPPFWMMVAGIIVAWVLYIYKPTTAVFISHKLRFVRNILENLYGFDKFNEVVFVKGSLVIGSIFNWIDTVLIDKIIVDGSAKLSMVIGKVLRVGQTGFVYHYSFFMIIALAISLLWVLFTMEVL
jgi:NADH-quinone oxidoreductase subunit L